MGATKLHGRLELASALTRRFTHVPWRIRDAIEATRWAIMHKHEFNKSEVTAAKKDLALLARIEVLLRADDERIARGEFFTELERLQHK